MGNALGRALRGRLPRAPTKPAERDARARFEEGLARVRASDFEGARVSFAQAYAVLHKPDILWNLALSEEKTQHPLEALIHFKEYLHEAPPDRHRPRAGRESTSSTSAPSRRTSRSSPPPGASITVDATRALGFAPLVDTVDVMPGRHSVAARLGAESKTARDRDRSRADRPRRPLRARRFGAAPRGPRPRSRAAAAAPNRRLFPPTRRRTGS